MKLNKTAIMDFVVIAFVWGISLTALYHVVNRIEILLIK